MKVLVLGAGAIGGFYGACLLQGGADVSFLVRPKRAAALAERGLVVRSDSAPFDAKVRAVATAAEAGPVDVVLLTCKAFDLPSAIEAIAPAVDAGAVVLPLLNGLACYARLDERFGRARVMGGAAQIAVSLLPSGEISHMGSLDRLVIGPREPGQQGLATELDATFRRAPGTRLLSPDIEQDLWNKWVGLAAGAAVTCLMRGSVGQILSTQDGATLVRQAIAECAAVAEASGHALPASALQQIGQRLLDRSSTWAASMMRDIAQGAPQLEADDIVGDLIARAAGFGQPAPLLRAAYCNLQTYAAQHATPA
jgi:2-dehydropantoate 2-reductase